MTDKHPPLLIREQFRSFFLTLTDSDIGKLIKALMAYQWPGESTIKLSDKLDGMFTVLKSFIDADNNKYADKKEQNRQNAHKRWEKENAEKS